MASLTARAVPLNDKGEAIVVVNIILAVVATITCAGRFWARSLTGQRWSWDDWLALASLIVNHIFMGITGAAAFHGLGQPVATLLATSPESVTVFLKVREQAKHFSMVHSSRSHKKKQAPLLPSPR